MSMVMSWWLMAMVDELEVGSIYYSYVALREMGVLVCGVLDRLTYPEFCYITLRSYI